MRCLRRNQSGWSQVLRRVRKKPIVGRSRTEFGLERSRVPDWQIPSRRRNRLAVVAVALGVVLVVVAVSILRDGKELSPAQYRHEARILVASMQSSVAGLLLNMSMSEYGVIESTRIVQRDVGYDIETISTITPPREYRTAHEALMAFALCCQKIAALQVMGFEEGWTSQIKQDFFNKANPATAHLHTLQSAIGESLTEIWGPGL